MTTKKFKVIQEMKDNARNFLKEAIKADKINLLNYVTASIEKSTEGYNNEIVINKNSLLNAPNIELL